MDIRSYFGPKTGSRDSGAKTDSSKAKSENRPKPVLSDSSSEDESESRNRKSGDKKDRKCSNTSQNKKRRALSDSEDEFIPSSVGKSKNGHSKKVEEKVAEKLKPVKADDFFASMAPAVKLPKIPKLPKKEPEVKKPEVEDKKRKSVETEFFDNDEDFESMLQDIDFDQEIVIPSPVKKPKLSDDVAKPTETLAQKLASKIKKEEKERKREKEDSVKEEKRSRDEERKKEKEKKKDDAKKEERDKERKKDDAKKEERDKERRKHDAKKEERDKEGRKDDAKKEGKEKERKKNEAKREDKEKEIKKEKSETERMKAEEEVKRLPESAPAKIKLEPSQSSQSQTSSQTQPPGGESSELWVEKYKPTSTKTIIGQQGDSSNMRKLTNWLRLWDQNNAGKGKNPNPKPPPWNSGADNGYWAKAALLSGPPGVGKTTTAYLVAKELGYDVMELNASDTRSKKQLDAVVTDAVSSQSLSKVSTKRILLMDEVDGMAGNEDRGGVAELIQLLKGSRIPVVCMCNDRNHPKIRSLANHCFDLRFHRPKVEQIRAAMMSICFKEKLKISPDALNELISGCNQDVRQVLHHLSMVKAKDFSDSVDGKFSLADAKEEADRAKKTSIKIGPWDVCRKVFSSSEKKSMTLSDKSDLFFHDYSIGPLFVQENYLAALPDAANHDPKKAVLLASKAADSLCHGDLVEKLIRSQNSWSLLPAQAMFSSVLPGEYMSGHIQGMIQFPNWLGKNSKQNKCDRILQELQMHTRLSAGLSKRCLSLDFGQHLRDAILRPMIKQGPDGVQDSVQVMSHYALLREDLDNLLEVTQWPNSPDPMKAIESKVKAAFTRSYNKDVVLPYATNLGSISKRSATIVTGETLLDGEEEEVDDDDEKDDDNIESDAMIKAKKPKAGKASAADSSAPAKASRGGKAAGAGARGGRGGRGKK